MQAFVGLAVLPALVVLWRSSTAKSFCRCDPTCSNPLQVARMPPQRFESQHAELPGMKNSPNPGHRALATDFWLPPCEIWGLWGRAGR